MGKDRRVKKRDKTRDSGDGIDYRKIHLNVKETVIAALCGMAVDAAVAWMFYRSFAALIPGLVFLPITIYLKTKDVRSKRAARLRREFREMMRITADALAAGYSLERAFEETERELKVLYDEECDIIREVRRINQRIEMKISVENSITDFAERSGDRDIRNFARIMVFARRGGGNFLQIIKSTVKQLDEKQETEQEIETMLAERSMEIKVMCIMPLGILMLLNLESSDFLTPLYEGLAGRSLMTILLGVYGIALLMAGKIMKIEV